MCLALKKVDTKVNKEWQTEKQKTRNAKKHLREETKMEIVHDYYLGALNKTHLAEKYGVGWETVHKIIRNFAAENDKMPSGTCKM